MLPKVLHLYWGRNKPLTYLRALTYLSFRALNPDWEIHLWVPNSVSVAKPWRSGEHPVEYSGRDYLLTLPFEEIDFSLIGVPEHFSEVHKSDLLRWYLLGEYGGLWADMDILFVKPITPHILQLWQGIGLCKYTVGGPYFQAIGFLYSEGIWGHTFFNKLFEFGLNKAETVKDIFPYQMFGAELLTEFLTIWEGRNVNYLDHRYVYLYRGDSHQDDMSQYFQAKPLMEDPMAIGYHWYAGNPICAKAEARINSTNIDKLSRHYAICRKAIEICPSNTAF